MVAALGEQSEDFVFLGGCALALYARSEGAPLRTTADVDCLSRRVPWSLQEKALADLCTSRVLRPDTEIQCRYRIIGTEIDVDVISPDGFNVGRPSPWLRRAAENFSLYDAGEGQKVKAVTPPYFMATKLVAFGDRGEDVLSSKDAEDIVALVVEVPSLFDDVIAAGIKDDIAELWRRASTRFHFAPGDIPDFVDAHLHREDRGHRQRVIDVIGSLWGD